MTRHVFDETSVLNPATGKPYGPGPLWAGTEPMDYPDPYCVCTALWDTETNRCSQQGTLAGDWWELGEAIRGLGRALEPVLGLLRRSRR